MAVKTYDSSKDTIVGDKLMLFVETKPATTDPVAEQILLPIAFGTSCGIDISADTIDTSNKMSGNWKEYLVGQIGYTVSSDSMLSMTEGDASFKKLKELMANRVPIQFVMAKTKKTAVSDFDKGEEFVRGRAIITSLSLKADNGAICTSSISMQGTGELEDGVAEPAGGGEPVE